MTELTLPELRAAFEAAKTETSLAHQNMVAHRNGINAGDYTEAEKLQHFYLAADANEMELLRKIEGAEAILDEQHYVSTDFSS